MKAKLILLLLVASASSVFAQKKIEIDESSRLMSKGTYPSFAAEIPQAKLKDVDKAWRKYISAGSKSKIVEAGDEINLVGAVNKNITTEVFNIYSKLLETTEGVKVTAWFSLNDSVYISKDQNNDKDLAVKKYMLDFALDQYREVVKDELKKEQDKTKDLEGEMKDLIKAEEKSNKKISEYERSIQRAHDDIATNNGDQKRQSDLIYTQKGVVEASKGNATVLKEAQKTLKDMENAKEKLEKQNEKLNKDIDSWNKEIREEQRKIEASKQDQKLKAEQIAKQKDTVQGVEEKLKNIK